MVDGSHVIWGWGKPQTPEGEKGIAGLNRKGRGTGSHGGRKSRGVGGRKPRSRRENRWLRSEKRRHFEKNEPVFNPDFYVTSGNA